LYPFMRPRYASEESAESCNVVTRHHKVKPVKTHSPLIIAQLDVGETMILLYNSPNHLKIFFDVLVLSGSHHSMVA